MTNRLTLSCGVRGCERKVHSRGLCTSHYMLARRRKLNPTEYKAKKNQKRVSGELQVKPRQDNYCERMGGDGGLISEESFARFCLSNQKTKLSSYCFGIRTSSVCETCEFGRKIREGQKILPKNVYLIKTEDNNGCSDST